MLCGWEGKRGSCFVGCSAPVLRYVDRLCSGRQVCEFPVAELHGNQPCPDDLAPYLEASYQCVPGNCRFHRRVSVSIRLSVIRPCSTETSGWIKL